MVADIKGESSLRCPPRIVCDSAHASFLALAESMQFAADDVWIGGYVEYEWNHLRPIIAAYGINVQGKRVLEFGSYIGASSLVFAQLGARVDGVEVLPGRVELARLNARRYGIEAAKFWHVADTQALPFESAVMDLVSCNSVLEYVEPAELKAVQQEIHRVLKPGGLILVTGTSSRLWPREVHSGAWLVNYLPRFIDAVLPLRWPLSRGVWPWAVRYGFGSGYINLDAEDSGRAFIAARSAMVPPKDGPAYRVVAVLARLLAIGPGMLMNNISCVLQKPAG